MQKGRVVLLLEGGVMRGIFTAAVLHALREMIGLTPGHFVKIIGTSAGAANGFIYTTGQCHLLEEVWFRHLLTQEFFHFHPRHLVGRGRRPLDMMHLRGVIEYVAAHVPEVYTEVIASATCLKRGVPVFFPVRRETAVDVLTVACAAPIATRPQRLEGMLLRDGVLTVPIPLDHALQEADRIVFISTKPKGATTRFLRRVSKLSLFVRYFGACEHATLMRLQELETQGRAICIFPNADVPGGKFNIDPVIGEAAWAMGQQVAREYARRLDQFLS